MRTADVHIQKATTVTMNAFHPLHGVRWISSFPILVDMAVLFGAADKVVSDSSCSFR